MFEVHAISPLDANWMAREDEMILAVGRQSDRSGSGTAARYYLWYVRDFGEAQFYKRKLSAITGVNVTIREK